MLNSSATALVVVDPQLDFEPQGALAVPRGDEIMEGIAILMRKHGVVVVTQDAHPPGHISFASSYNDKKPFDRLTLSEAQNSDELIRRTDHSARFSKDDLIEYLSLTSGREQILWPDHCVEGSTGMNCDSRIPLSRATLILRKGTSIRCDSYSAFRENDGSNTGLGVFLKGRGISKIILCGLAADYCVAWSAEDARREGFEVELPLSLTRFIEQDETKQRAMINHWQNSGITIS